MSRADEGRQPSLRGEPAWRLVVLSSKGGTRFILLPRSAGTDMADLSVSPTLRFCPPFVPWPASSLPPLPSPNPPGSVLTALNPAHAGVGAGMGAGMGAGVGAGVGVGVGVGVVLLEWVC